ncbi:hypothetical protein ACFMPD_02990 [Sedimentitalea sp. HM32M-2]|uniref:hypothetical protein n=1 Tax=Sedimentitalea sp. HM32M-2 TaxID=3351566 RepID=UPI0036442956
MNDFLSLCAAAMFCAVALASSVPNELRDTALQPGSAGLIAPPAADPQAAPVPRIVLAGAADVTHKDGDADCPDALATGASVLDDVVARLFCPAAPRMASASYGRGAEPGLF